MNNIFDVTCLKTNGKVRSHQDNIRRLKSTKKHKINSIFFYWSINQCINSNKNVIITLKI